MEQTRADFTPAADGDVRSASAGTWTAALPIELRIMGAAFAFLLVTSVVGFIGTVTIPDYQDQRFTVFREANPFWDRFARYDSGWYHGIASRGYTYVEGGRSNLAFFPLYPQLMGTVGRAFGGAQHHFYLAGILVSWLSFIIAMPLLYRLARLDLPRAAAIRATTYAAALPSSYFFGLVYSESLFLLALVGATLALRTRHWLWAAVFGAALTATRVNGVMFVPALAWLAWRAAGPNRRDRTAALMVAAASLIGIGGYCYFNYRLSGNPFEWYDSITRWNYTPGGNPFAGIYGVTEALIRRPIQYLTQERMAPYDTLNTLSAVLALWTVPFVWKRFGTGYAAVIVLGLVLPLSSGQLEGLGRYCAVLFPIALLLGGLEGEARHTWLLASFCLFYSLGLILFGNVHPLF
jgi:hypothetical protein